MGNKGKKKVRSKQQQPAAATLAGGGPKGKKAAAAPITPMMPQRKGPQPPQQQQRGQGKKHPRDQAAPTAVVKQQPVSKKPRVEAAKASGKKNTNTAATTPTSTSTSTGKGLEWLLSPVTEATFFKEHWEKKPLHVKRPTDRNYYDGLFSLDQLMQVVKERELAFGKNINVAIYKDGEKIDQNPDGIAEVPQLKEFWKLGSTFQVLHPQQYTGGLWQVCAEMEARFGCLVGANSYLTPPASQGLAPHFDDVEVFILQLEGKKHWTLHESDMSLPREYSPDLAEEELPPPIMEVDLEPGDLLYFPRGTIHYARTFEDVHSTHMTISTYQKWTWFDFLQAALPDALERAFHEDEDFRQGLPVNFLSYMGTAHDTGSLEPEEDDEEGGPVKPKPKAQTPLQKKCKQQQDDFLRKFAQLVQKVVVSVDLHDAASSMAVDFAAHRMPPYRAPTPDTEDKSELLKFLDDGEADMLQEGSPIMYINTPMPKSDDTLIRLTNPDWFEMVVSTDDGDEDDCCASGECDDHGCGDGEEEEDEEEDEDDPKGKKRATSQAGGENGHGKKDQKVKGKKPAKNDSEEDSEDDEDDEDDDDDDGEGRLLLFHCLSNSREHHMDGSYMRENSNPNYVELPLYYGPAITYLVQQYPAYVPMNSLPYLPAPKERFGLAATLWSHGLLETKK